MNNSVSSVVTVDKYVARNRKLRKVRKVASNLFRLISLISVGYIVLYPLLYMVVTSISTNESLASSSRIWIPSSVTLENYKFVADVMKFGKSIWSTFSNEILAALIEVCSCAVVAYGFARYEFKLKKPLMGILYLTILIPLSMLIIPLSVNFSQLDFVGILGLFNKLTGIDLRPNLIGTPFAFWLPAFLASGLQSGILILIYIQFFKEMPAEFEEAAQVDGAGPIRTFIKIIIPSSGVVIITVLIFSLIWHWNDYQMALMYMDENYPLSVQLSMLGDNLTMRGFYMSQSTPIVSAYLMCGCVMFVLPLLIVYMIVQRWFIESVDRVGITG